MSMKYNTVGPIIDSKHNPHVLIIVTLNTGSNSSVRILQCTVQSCLLTLREGNRYEPVQTSMNQFKPVASYCSCCIDYYVALALRVHVW